MAVKVKRILKIAMLVLALAFAAAQFVRPDRTNPQENPADTIEATTPIPSDVGNILSRSCVDCHSNRTVYPWYSNISPVSWYLKSHIDHGRSHLNLSTWNTLSTSQKARKLDELCETVEDGEMPLPSYLWIHHDAALRPGEAEILCSWSDAEKDRLEKLLQ